MRPFTMIGSLAVCCALSTAVCGAAPADVPAGHRAHAAVASMTALGIMPASKAGFVGNAPVSSEDLAQILYRFVRAIEDGKAATFKATPSRKPAARTAWERRPVTRYEVAEVLYRTGAFIAANPPANRGKPDLSTGLPIEKSAASVPASSPAATAVRELVKRRMVWRRMHELDSHTNSYYDVERSVLLSPGKRPVTGAQFADAVSQVVSGYYDTRTAEPQWREDKPRPARPLPR